MTTPPAPPAFADARVVLDTSVLFGAFPRYLLLSLAVGGVYDALWSVPILDELERVLVRERISPAAAARQRRGLVADFPFALPTAGLPAMPPDTLLPDPNDWDVMATALAHAPVGGGPPLILTWNLGHFSRRVFSQATLAPLGLRADSPDRWVVRLYAAATAAGAAADVHRALLEHRRTLGDRSGATPLPMAEPQYRARMGATGYEALERLLPSGAI